MNEQDVSKLETGRRTTVSSGTPLLPVLDYSTGRIPIFASWFGVPRRCDVTVTPKHVVYSRGNNNPDEMQDQHAKTGNTYQYETGKFDLTLIGDPFCFCRDKLCAGFIRLTLKLKITLVPGWDALGFVLLAGPPPSVPTTEKPGFVPPEPDLVVKLDSVDLPAAQPGNAFTQPDLAKNEFFAAASHEVPCRAGTYARRFYIVPAGAAGQRGVEPGAGGSLAAFVDCNVTIVETAECELKVTSKVYLLEFVPGFNFTNGGATPEGDQEFPEVDHTDSAGVGGQARNIAKLIEEDGKAVDRPFVPK